MRFYNTAGPVRCQDHYCLPPLTRFDLPEILTLLSQKKYFVLHAPRQSGKTSCLLALREYLNNSGEYRSLYINVETAQAARDDVENGVRSIIVEIKKRMEQSPVFTGLGRGYCRFMGQYQLPTKVEVIRPICAYVVSGVLLG